MAYAGARGETERQMAEALRFALPQDRLHPAFTRLSLALAGCTGLELSIANSLWGQTGYPFLPSFLCLLAEVYGAPINRWVEVETREGIRELIPVGGIDPDTRLVLANAVYFKAAWMLPFSERATRDARSTSSMGGRSSPPRWSRRLRWATLPGRGTKWSNSPTRAGRPPS